MKKISSALLISSILLSSSVFAYEITESGEHTVADIIKEVQVSNLSPAIQRKLEQFLKDRLQHQKRETSAKQDLNSSIENLKGIDDVKTSAWTADFRYGNIETNMDGVSATIAGWTPDEGGPK